VKLDVLRQGVFAEPCGSRICDGLSALGPLDKSVWAVSTTASQRATNAVVGSVVDKTFNSPSRHQRQNQVRLAIVFTQVVNLEDVGVVTKTPLVQDTVVGQVDFLLSALAQELFDLVAAIGEGGMVVCCDGRRIRRKGRRRLTCCRRRGTN